MGKLADLLLVMLLTALAFACGWHTRGWHDGSTVTTSSADARTQAAVAANAAAAVGIDRAQSVTESAVERVRYVTRTVTVAPECPPGAGAVSDLVAADLREAIK